MPRGTDMNRGVQAPSPHTGIYPVILSFMTTSSTRLLFFWILDVIPGFVGSLDPILGFVRSLFCC